MFRVLFWVVIYILTLGLSNIEVTYKDGLHVKLNSWWTLLKRRRESRSKKEE